MNAIPQPLFLSMCASLGLAAGLSGCAESLACSDGTHQDGSQCVADLSPACGAGTKLDNGACVPDNGGGAACGAGTHLQAGTCVADIQLKGNATRFYDVSLTAPAAFVNLANGPLHDSFHTGANLLFIGEYQPDATTQRIFGGGGTRTKDGWYALDRAHMFDAAVTVASGKFTSLPFTAQIVAFGSQTPITLVGTVISNGVMSSPEGVTLVDSGNLAGVLTPENADKVFIVSANSTLLQLTKNLQIPPDVDFDHNGTAESWTMSLTFATTPVWLF